MQGPQERADSFLRLIRKSRRGKLKIYLGYCAGVGKTYHMLEEGHRLVNEGLDVIIGLLETHGRQDIVELAKGLKVIPRKREQYRGHALEEMDVDAIITRNPEVALVDELAHTNVPGIRNSKRYEDVQEILAAGIHVITTLNVQHLESLYDTVEKSVHVKVRERIPDWVVSNADEIVNVDLTTTDLLERLKDGKIYPKERIESALSNFFQNSNLHKLRELTLRETASQIDIRMREDAKESSDPTPDQVMICLSSRGPNSEILLRYASRLAGRLNRNWYAVYVQTPSESPTEIDSHTQRILSSTLTLAKQLGAMAFTYKGEDVVETILRFAEEYRVGHIVIGHPGEIPFWKRILGKRTLVDELIEKSKNITIVVLDTRSTKKLKILPQTTKENKIPISNNQETRPNLSSMLSSRRIVIWDEPVDKELVLKTLIEMTAMDVEACDSEEIIQKVKKREDQSSTFFSDQKIAIPHIRLEGISSPLIAIGLTKKGFKENFHINPINSVFLVLSPAHLPNAQIQVLALISQAVKNRQLVATLSQSNSPEEIISIFREWEK
jgi:two-component system, OmpR family, sensor histidine kinase KdpD